MDTITTMDNTGNKYVGNHIHTDYAEKQHGHYHGDHDHHHHHCPDHEHEEYEHHCHDEKYAKKGVAQTALGLGIAGTALGVYNAWKESCEEKYGRGRRGGYYEEERGGRYYGERREECHEERKVTHFELHQEKEIAALKATLAKQEAERYAEGADFKLYKEFDHKIEGTEKGLYHKIEYLSEKVCNLEKTCAVAEAKTEGKFEALKGMMVDFKEDLYGVKTGASAEIRAAIALEAERRDCCCKELSGKIHLEAERRECGDKNVYDYVNCNFVRNKKVLPIEEICPEVMPRFNCFDLDKVECDDEKKSKSGK